MNAFDKFYGKLENQANGHSQAPISDDDLVIFNAIYTLKETNRLAQEALENVRGVFGTPIARRKYGGGMFYEETMESVATALTAMNGDVK